MTSQIRYHIAVAYHSVAQLVDDVASALAFAFAFHDSGEWLLEPGRKLDNAHLYIYGSDSERTANSHNEEQDISDLYTPQYASTAASYQHNVVSLDIDRRHADIWLHDAVTTDVAAGGVILVVDPKPVFPLLRPN